MEKSCKTCKHCIHINSETSPGGVMFIDNYVCANKESTHFENDMNKITAQGSTLDARESEGCDKWSNQVLNDNQKEIIEELRQTRSVMMDLPMDLCKGDRKVSIQDVDDSSKVTVNDEINSVSYNNGKIAINKGEEIEVPNKVMAAKPNCILQEDGVIYINGYKHVDGKFKRTLLTWLKCLFS